MERNRFRAPAGRHVCSKPSESVSEPKRGGMFVANRTRQLPKLRRSGTDLN
jgi:hypothetical protein